MFCRKCGNKIPNDSGFCYKCGARVLTSESQDKPISLEKKSVTLESKKIDDKKTEKFSVAFNSDKGGFVCSKCGSKILNPSVKYCPYCSWESSSTNNVPPKITSRKCDDCGELVYNNQRSCHNCGATNPSYNSRFDNSEAYNILRNNSSQNKVARYPQVQSSGSTSSNEDVIHKCRNCGKKVGNNQRTCPKCGTSNPYYDPEFEAKINNTVNRAMTKAVSEVQKDYSCSEEYESLKKGTLIALYVIMGIVVLVCMATGQLAFLGCPSPIEYEVGYTTNGMLTIFGWAIGLNIARAIFLCVCKAVHK